ncbi:DNA repair protein RadC [Acidithiobacillus sp. CV18-2]|uniref:DNA repair protein RadC n=1 Tax=Igneacidithiobacillus copahuensis TaxID=2724909 RepID=A0AAE2YPE4_9PROT|nr:DNA repair protein RadC [Igneacidithiobacillus copahuensis]MBU2755819.1 DNA repair protein RadC [Acidithiobacillus sp. CV18-3]MBU2756266.1 DNA repair protein RadC [Acidithiobacillus sp. BN09-2]MBU2777773.1 DNA repair protein RadC [Acidithiobacillus sp. CV18-2]MBU2795957.1 DNA repair protein RadC [Acidithiobacillus sp. VAN18-2]MBU2800495.1 DNA repair protein RadC [Acidithiobacillus sp. VAN18-4]UTV80409.1 DNA repair protein RadC [Acidithiobacillus sp. YTS05]
MAIRDWPTDERPRERLLAKGAESLSDAELLAIFLRVGVRGKSAVELARDLLQRFGGLRGLLTAPQESFCAEHGLGTAKFAQLQAVLEMARRHLAESWQRGEALESPRRVTEYLRASLRDRAREVFAVLFLDQRHRVLRFEEMFQGTIDSASVHIREVAKRALELNAAALIVAHNHPSGVAEPSTADRQLTRRLEDALRLLDLRLLDHFIVGDGEPVSLREAGGW